MRVLVLGSNGFMGSHVEEAFQAADHETHTANRIAGEGEYSHQVDLLDPESVGRVIDEVQPEAIVNSAGVLENGPGAEDNVLMSRNVVSAASGRDVGRVVILGSAAEYGIVGTTDPVAEGDSKNGSNAYAEAKKRETKEAVELGKETGVPVTVARIFNPLGVGMQEKMLLPNLLATLAESDGENGVTVEIGRRDAERDYFDAEDAARAIVAIVEGEPRHDEYNIGSGTATTTGEIVGFVADAWGEGVSVDVQETSSEPEPVVAARADISLIRDDLGWEPTGSAKEAVERAVHAFQEEN